MNFKSYKRKCTFSNLRKYFSLVLVLCLWGIAPQLKAQTKLSESGEFIKGKVSDELNEPMIGVAIIEKGSKNVTVTDINGKFQLKVSSSEPKIFISYIGYESKELKGVNGEMNIQLVPDVKMMEEVVVVGYGVQKKATMVGAVTQATAGDIRRQGTVVNLTQALTGAMPGITVLNTSGIP
jgi:hypothetical protein